MLKKILLRLIEAISFMSMAVVFNIYVFKSEASISLLIQYFATGIIFTLLFKTGKYFAKNKSGNNKKPQESI
jgi:hypothetical protein